MIDRRIRLRPRPAAQNYVYGDSGDLSKPTLLSILRSTNGMVWNYTPTISEQRSVSYETQQTMHSNSNYNNYKNTSNAVISVQGDFYSNTATEAMYTLACMNFVRACSLMDFGRQAAVANNPDIAVVGSPPPILLFSGYGRYMYNDVPVIIKSYSFNFNSETQMIQVPVDSITSHFNVTDQDSRQFFNNLRSAGFMNPENEVWIPQKLPITIQLEEQPTSDYMTKEFNLNAFKRGALMRKGGFI